MFSQKSQRDYKKELMRNMLKPCLKKFQDLRVMQVQKDITQCICELETNKMNLLALDESKRRLCRIFTGTIRISTDELIVKVNDALVKRLEDYSKRQSLIDSEKYSEKVVDKILEKLAGSVVVSLSIEGNLWKESTLSVTTATGEIFQFVTKTIINQTGFGYRFYQFPTRMREVKSVIKQSAL